MRFAEGKLLRRCLLVFGIILSAPTSFGAQRGKLPECPRGSLLAQWEAKGKHRAMLCGSQGADGILRAGFGLYRVHQQGKLKKIYGSQAGTDYRLKHEDGVNYLEELAGQPRRPVFRLDIDCDHRCEFIPSCIDWRKLRKGPLKPPLAEYVSGFKFSSPYKSYLRKAYYRDLYETTTLALEGDEAAVELFRLVPAHGWGTPTGLSGKAAAAFGNQARLVLRALELGCVY